MLGQKHLFAELEELQKEGGPIEVKYVSDLYEIYSSRIIGCSLNQSSSVSWKAIYESSDRWRFKQTSLK